MATGTKNTTGIATTKRLVAIPKVIVALDLDEGIGPSKGHLVMKTPTSGRKLAVEEDKKIPIVSG
jgi:hypothetical protein